MLQSVINNWEFKLPEEATMERWVRESPRLRILLDEEKRHLSTTDPNVCLTKKWLLYRANIAVSSTFRFLQGIESFIDSNRYVYVIVYSLLIPKNVY